MMDNYQAMNFYYGLLNLRAGFLRLTYAKY